MDIATDDQHITFSSPISADTGHDHVGCFNPNGVIGCGHAVGLIEGAGG